MTRILSGTAAVLAGSRTVAFTGDPLSDANCPVDGTVVLGGASYFIASRTDTSHFELTRDYEGVDGSVSCEIDPLNANAINLVKVARSITEYNAKLALTDAYGKGLFYESIGFTGANDPGPGKLARNAAAWADSTEVYMDVLDYGGHEQGALIDLAKAGTVYIVRGIDTGAYAAYTLSAAPQNMGPDEWRKISLSYVDGDGLIADGELVAVEWNRKGESFAADAEVDDMAGRAAYDNEAPGFVVKVNDDGTGRAVFFTKGAGAGVWGSPAYLTGTKGDKGDQGDKGWAPQLAAVSDGARRLYKLSGYVGGAGAAPTDNVGDYLKGDGTFTANIAEAEDFRGAPGINGTGAVASVEAGDGISVDNSDPTAPVVNAIAFTGDIGSGGTIGAVPPPIAGDAAASKFLKASGLWEKVTSITSVVTRVFVSSGTYTPTSGMLFCEIECFGGGGGGGGSIAATGTNITGAGGGGSGAYSRKWASAADIGVSKPVTVGAAGGGAAAGANAGGSGSATSVGALCVANGGSPGQGVTSLFSFGGAGGSTVGAVGDMVLPGNTGNTGSYSSINTSFPRVFGAPGADPPMGVGKGGIGQVQSNGSTATGYSAGGGGGSDMGGTARAGGSSAQGIVIITEYIG